MNYLDSAWRTYKEFESANFKEIFGNIITDYVKISTLVEEKFRFDSLRKIYMHDIEDTIDRCLPFYKDDLYKFLKYHEVTYYGKNLPLRTLSFLMWIWEKKLDISKKSLQTFIDSIFLGTVGYKIIDYSADNVTGSKPEFALIGFYSIKLAEKMLVEVFKPENTEETIAEYFSLYVEVELVEKKHRWKDCPFSWDEVNVLGKKAAPILTIYKTLFNYAGYDPSKIKELMDSLLNISAVIQIIDDLADIKQDLTNGYETLVMKDYYKTFGVDEEVTNEKINHILSQDRLMLIYHTGQKLFANARSVFNKHNENTLQVFSELMNLNFTTLFQIA